MNVIVPAVATEEMVEATRDYWKTDFDYARERVQAYYDALLSARPMRDEAERVFTVLQSIPYFEHRPFELGEYTNRVLAALGLIAESGETNV